MTQSWRPPRSPQERVQRALKSMSPGTLEGRVAQAKPVQPARSGQVTVEPEDGSAFEIIEFYQDEVTLTRDGLQSFETTYVPIKHSEHLYWNGVYQRIEESWTRDDDTTIVTLLDAAEAGDVAPATGDEVTIEYAHYVEADLPLDVMFVGASTAEDDSPTMPWPTGMSDGDLFIACASLSGVIAANDSRIVGQHRFSTHAMVVWGYASNLGTPLGFAASGGFGGWGGRAMVGYSGARVSTAKLSATPGSNTQTVPVVEERGVVVAYMGYSGTVAPGSVYETSNPKVYTRRVVANRVYDTAALFEWRSADGEVEPNPSATLAADGTPGNADLLLLGISNKVGTR